MTRKSKITLAVGLVLALTLLGLWLVPTLLGRLQPAPTSQFIERRGTQFFVGEEPFRFTGFNVYDAAATAGYSCDAQSNLAGTDLTELFRTIRDQTGSDVIRFWAFQTYTKSGTDFSGVDRVIAAAKANGMYVIPVLEDGPGYCTTGQWRQAKTQVDSDTYYTDGYQRPFGSAGLSLRDYARVMGEHYRDEPTIAAWMLVNEAETTRRLNDGRSALVPFAQDVGGVMKAASPRHLVTLGTQSNGAPGTSGPDFRDIYSLPQLDFAEVHDWAHYGSDDQAMPGAESGTRLPDPNSGECTQQSARIGCSFALARAMGVPIVVGEAGIEARDPQGRDRRADLLQRKMDAAFDAGATGYLIWQLNQNNGDGYAVSLTDSDPFIERMRSVSDARATAP